MSFLRVPLFTLISHYSLTHLGFCKAYQNCWVALIKITTVRIFHFSFVKNRRCSFQEIDPRNGEIWRSVNFFCCNGVVHLNWVFQYKEVHSASVNYRVQQNFASMHCLICYLEVGLDQLAKLKPAALRCLTCHKSLCELRLFTPKTLTVVTAKPGGIGSCIFPWTKIFTRATQKDNPLKAGQFFSNQYISQGEIFYLRYSCWHQLCITP